MLKKEEILKRIIYTYILGKGASEKRINHMELAYFLSEELNKINERLDKIENQCEHKNIFAGICNKCGKDFVRETPKQEKFQDYCDSRTDEERANEPESVLTVSKTEEELSQDQKEGWWEELELTVMRYGEKFGTLEAPERREDIRKAVRKSHLQLLKEIEGEIEKYIHSLDSLDEIDPKEIKQILTRYKNN